MASPRARGDGYCVILAGVSACGGGGGGGGGLPILPPTGGVPIQPGPSTSGRVVTDTFQSTANGVRYSIEIFIPTAYDSSSDAVPTIYALDGDATNGLPDTRFTNLKNILVKRGTKAILIGIGNSARRQEDYNFPGANAYHTFLAKELIPYVESKYRADPKKRMLTGLSTSGNLAATALFLEAPDNLVFSYFISIEAAFWQQETQNYDLEKKMFDALAGRPLPVTLILAHCVSGGNEPAVMAMYRRMAARGYAGLQLLDTAFDATHVGADVLAFEDAIVRIFK
ncbi:alpha/beta hydrolase-fold protein [Variovorax sp. ZS18.2.2]|uniref:alpha/beta hydrolase n=1 Tax=Variovorax sp. ZS18.2.2 TaxID=2971255 RepID=UPI002150F513|nr:alpha/beta hydrolase-fold protein [Variovorax sp. ZS18.2.2]MCR6476296.1 alpha/beta hydrolase-fold protein [Variovorax sp. ZS18.2.2]